ncbi:MAG: FHA domain-containing protein [Actinomycetota bacterium]|nr:FHA domain-containing protein [Actinomycetota bacterium]
MPESLLTILKFCFLALLWLFFLRVLRAVWTEVNAPAPAPASAMTSAAPAKTSSRAPAADAAARLKVVEPPARRGTVYELGDELTVGRANGCQVALSDDSYVSQLHARVFRKDNRLWLEDLGSTNGTFLNAKPVSAPVALRRGDRVQIGRTVLEVTK